MKKLIMLLTLSLFFVACQEEGVTIKTSESQSTNRVDKNLIKKVEVNFNAGIQAKRASKSISDDAIQNFMIQINGAIAGQGIMLEKVEFLGAEEEGRTVFFKNLGNKQLSSDFVPNDPSNVGGIAVPYWIDNTQLGTSSGMSGLETFDAMVSTMNTWDNIACSEGLVMPFIGTSSDFGVGDAGFVQFLTGHGGFSGYIPGTILHGGILSPVFFEDVLGPGAGNGVIGVTFTFTWTDDITGDPLDIDKNGKSDVAIKEIYINDNFNFQNAPNDMLFDAGGVIDFETVVLHEVGHGLSQGHFGTAFRDSGNGGLHFSPAALMNAGYTVGRREIALTDKAGHCSIWGNWPNN